MPKKQDSKTERNSKSGAAKWAKIRLVLRFVPMRKRERIVPIGTVAPIPPFWPRIAAPADLAVISCVMDKQLFISNWRGADDQSRLSALGVTHVAAIGEEFIADADVAGLTFFRCDISDEDCVAEKMGQQLQKVAAFVHDALAGGGRCLVHCAAGISRSATVVLAYRMLHGGLRLREAFAELHTCRQCVWPNDGFMLQLITLESELYGSSSIDIEDYIRWGSYDPDDTGIIVSEPEPGKAHASSTGSRCNGSTSEAAAPKASGGGRTAKDSDLEARCSAEAARSACSGGSSKSRNSRRGSVTTIGKVIAAPFTQPLKVMRFMLRRQDTTLDIEQRTQREYERTHREESTLREDARESERAKGRSSEQRMSEGSRSRRAEIEKQMSDETVKAKTSQAA